jgi:signal peptidase I
MNAIPPGERLRSYKGPDVMSRRTVLAAAVSVLVGGALASCSAATQAAADAATTHRLTVDSDSMDPTIVQGQVIAVDELASGTYQPRRQDIVVVHPTAEYAAMQPGELMIRRVIAVPGDTVSCDGIGSPLILNGAALTEPYLHKGDAPSVIPFNVKVPAGCLWLLGDHRAIALDCRYHLSDPDQGAIPIPNVVGTYQSKA